MPGGRNSADNTRSGGFPSGEGLWTVAIVFASLVLYGRTIGFGWVYDDQMEIVLNPLIRSLSNLPQLFVTTVWEGSGMETYLYRPLALVTYSFNHTISGLAPWSYHLGNVLLHGGVSLLVFRLGRLWGLSLLTAGMGGLIFAVHPVHVEVVAAVFGRKDLLAGFFVLAMLLLHGPAATRGGWRATLPAVAYACAMLSKEVGVAGIALVAVQDWILTRDRAKLARDGRRAGLYVAYVATLLGYVLIRNRVTGGVGVPETFYMDNPLVAVPLLPRLVTAVAVLGKGLALQLAPLALSPDYSFDAIPLVTSPLDWRLLGMIAGIAALAWSLSRSSPKRWAGQDSPSLVLLLATLWYFVTILPTSNILVPVGTIFGERLLYLPSVAFSLLAGAGIGWLVRGGTGSQTQGKESPGGMGTLRTVGFVLSVGWLAGLVLQTTAYSSAWSDDISLFRHAVATVPNSTKANHKLGEELLRVGDIGGALPLLRRALEIAPDNEFAARTLAGARQRVANRYLPTEPGESPTAAPPDDPEILYLLGQINMESGAFQEAGSFWEAALSADPTHAPSRGDLGVLRLIQGDTLAALENLQTAVALDSSLASAWFNLGRIHLAQGRPGAAREALRLFIETAGNRFPDQAAWARSTLSSLPWD